MYMNEGEDYCFKCHKSKTNRDCVCVGDTGSYRLFD